MNRTTILRRRDQMPIRKILEMEKELEAQIKSLEQMFKNLHEETRKLIKDEKFYREESKEDREQV